MNYAQSARNALALLTKFGQALTVTHNVAGAYDPTQGSAAVTTSQTVTVGAVFDVGARQIDGQMVIAGDKRLLLPAIATKPQISDSVSIGGVSWLITTVNELNPAGTVLLYECNIRK